ncbi:MAG: DUF4139 domain-containing protein [Armatimonadaceae bacterium]
MSEKETAEGTLPVKAVTLFSSGVSYTLHEGEVDAGETSVALTFRTPQISDILKSLVLLDDGGTVRAATYPSHDPMERTLKSFAINVTHNLTREELLRQQVRGAEVRVQTTAGEILTGRVVGVETGEEALSEGRTVAVHTLLLLGEEGMQAVRLDRVQTMRLLDARLDREFRDALATLSSRSDDNRRQVTLTFSGDKQRTVRVGYVSESPIWKVSYRLVLSEQGKPYLQGWALVENTTEEDWNGVQLSLVSGRPVSFIQDLYQPLYVSRPVVAPDIIASPYPQLHAGDRSEPSADAYAETLGGMPMAMPPAAAAPMMEDDSARMIRSSAYGGRLMAKAERRTQMEPTKLKDAVGSQATGESAGELFEYDIREPVTLPRQQAAMIPIVSEEFEGEKLSLYNADIDPRFPLNAFRLKNTSTLHLKGGPVTVFDGGIYAGDARMEDVPPGDSRLITYAVDLAVEAERQEGRGTTTKETLSIRRGILLLKRFERRETIYVLKSRAKKERQVLIEHPFLSDWTLLEPESPTERTPDRYRFAVSLLPGATETRKVRTEKPIIQQVGLLDADLNLLSQYSTAGEIEESSREALSEVLKRRSEIQRIEATIHDRERERDGIFEEQERIRKNLGAVESGSSLYRRYMTQLEQQENRLAELNTELERLHAEALAKNTAVREYVDTIRVE